MSAADKKRWYLVIVQFSKGTETMMERLQRDVPTIDATLNKLSDGACEVVLPGQTACWVLCTTASSKHITARIHNPDAKPEDFGQREVSPDTTRKDDKIVVFQLGEDKCLTNLNRIRSWLDRAWKID